MKVKHYFIIVFSALFFICLSGCQTNVEETYTVWTDVGTYSEFYSLTNTTLNDGMYIRLEIPSSSWNQMSASLTDEGKHEWTKDKLKDWFIGRGFGETESNQEISWLSTIDHGLIASRTGSTVYMLLK